jgi:hypothetical protein
MVITNRQVFFSFSQRTGLRALVDFKKLFVSDGVDVAGFPVIIKRLFTAQLNERIKSMRKLFMMFFVLVLMLGGLSMTAYAADCGKDTPADKVGDWFGTLGKKGMEKDQILAKRKADRLLACVKREAEKAAKEVQKSGNDMKKRLGF